MLNKKGGNFMYDMDIQLFYKLTKIVQDSILICYCEDILRQINRKCEEGAKVSDILLLLSRLSKEASDGKNLDKLATVRFFLENIGTACSLKDINERLLTLANAISDMKNKNRESQVEVIHQMEQSDNPILQEIAITLQNGEGLKDALYKGIRQITSILSGNDDGTPNMGGRSH